MYLVLIHWKPAEAEPRRALLTRAGYSVEVAAPSGSAGLRWINADVDAVLIDLDRLPMQGRAVGIELRKRAATRSIPLIFVGGVPDKVSAVRSLLPDAGYLEWSDLPRELERTVRRAPTSVVVPGTMAGYSGTPLAKKFGLKAGSVVALLGAPQGFEDLLAPLPEGVRMAPKPDHADRAVVFIRTLLDLERRWDKVTAAVAPGATVWIAWPKKTSGVVTDATERAIRAWGLDRGWVDYKICAIDETWSGLAFARRKPKS